MSSSKKRPFSEVKGGDFYLCSDCDTVYHGQQELCEHLAKHSNLRRQARKRICLRKKQKNVLSYTKLPQELIPSKLTDNGSTTATANVKKLSGIEELTKATKMNDHYYTYHQLKMALNTIIQTRPQPAHSLLTSLDIIHDINVLRHTAQKLGLQCANTRLFDRIQSKILGANFKAPPSKINEKVVKTVTKKKRNTEEAMQNGKQEMDEDNEQKKEDDQYEMVEEEKTVQFEFDSSDFQRYLDANSEIIGRLQTIRKEKSFYGVTQEEIDLNKQFAENTAAMVHYSSVPSRLLA